MLVTFTIDNENFSTLDVSQDLEVENFLALVAMENPSVSTTDSTFVMVVNGRQWRIDNDVLKMKLYEIGVGNNDMIAILKVQPRQAPGTSRPAMAGGSTQASSSAGRSGGGNANLSDLIRSIKVPPKSSKPKPRPNAQNIQEYIEAMVKRVNPEQLHQRARNLFIQMSSPLAQLRFKDEYPSTVAQYVKEPTNYEAFYAAMIADTKDFHRRLALAHCDPSSVEGQQLIADIIKREAHNEQLQKAMTEMPEAFIRSHMLYVKLRINGVETIGFVDSGAQVTTISSAHAQKFNLGEKIDKNFSTVIRGVGGEQASDGRIHSADITMNETHVFPAPLTVLQRFGEDVLIGLDTLRRHGACIDLKKNCLRFGNDVEVPFLNEEEYRKECKRLGIRANLPPEDKEVLPEAEVDNEKVAELVHLGFDAHMAVRALSISHNDIVYACDLLQSDDPSVKEKLQSGAASTTTSQQPGPSNTSDKPKDEEEPMEHQ